MKLLLTSSIFLLATAAVYCLPPIMLADSTTTSNAATTTTTAAATTATTAAAADTTTSAAAAGTTTTAAGTTTTAAGTTTTAAAAGTTTTAAAAGTTTTAAAAGTTTTVTQGTGSTTSAPAQVTTTAGTGPTTTAAPTTTTAEPPKGADCQEIYEKGDNSSEIIGLITFRGAVTSDVPVYCDQDVDGGGWTVIQRRIDNSVSFYQNWENYTSKEAGGFGSVGNGNYWIALEIIQEYIEKITTSVELRIDLWDCFGRRSYVKYDNFKLTGENFTITVDLSENGGAGNSFNSSAAAFVQNGMDFSSPDKDNDKLPIYNCAEFYGGGWWFNECGIGNLNGYYYNGCYYTSIFTNGILWTSWKSNFYSAARAEMKIREKKVTTAKPGSTSTAAAGSTVTNTATTTTTQQPTTTTAV